jgi:hypothetical protein
MALVAAAGGCTADDGKSPAWTAPSASVSGSAPPWTEPGAYGYVLTRGCDEAAPLGRYRVTVRDRAVVGSERLDVRTSTPSAGTDVDLGPITGQNGEEIEVPTLGGLLEMARTAGEDGGEVTTVAGPDGQPVKVVINVSGQGPGGAECWSVSDYAVTP